MRTHFRVRFTTMDGSSRVIFGHDGSNEKAFIGGGVNDDGYMSTGTPVFLMTYLALVVPTGHLFGGWFRLRGVHKPVQ